MTYTGTMITDLTQAAARAERRAAERYRLRMARICNALISDDGAICNREYADHSHAEAYCPNPEGGPDWFLTTTFTESTCQTNVNDQECGKKSLPGTEFCTEHQGE